MQSIFLLLIQLRLLMRFSFGSFTYFLRVFPSKLQIFFFATHFFFFPSTFMTKYDVFSLHSSLFLNITSIKVSFCSTIFGKRKCLYIIFNNSISVSLRIYLNNITRFRAKENDETFQQENFHNKCMLFIKNSFNHYHKEKGKYAMKM